MKFCYENINDDIIGYYEKKGNKIIIHYLNKEDKMIDFSVEKEILLLGQMLSQAQDRNIKYLNNKIKNTYKLESIVMLINSTILFALGYIDLKYISKFIPNERIVYTSMAVCFGLSLFSFIVGIKDLDKDKEEIDELEKYKIYLSIREDITKHSSNPYICNNINKNSNYLNINTLDNYTLDEIKCIRKNINELKKIKTLKK